MRCPASSRTWRRAGMWKWLAIGRRSTLKFQTPICSVWKVPRYTSLATPQMLAFLCRCSQTGYESSCNPDNGVFDGVAHFIRTEMALNAWYLLCTSRIFFFHMLTLTLTLTLLGVLRNVWYHWTTHRAQNCRFSFPFGDHMTWILGKFYCYTRDSRPVLSPLSEMVSQLCRISMAIPSQWYLDIKKHWQKWCRMSHEVVLTCSPVWTLMIWKVSLIIIISQHWLFM